MSAYLCSIIKRRLSIVRARIKPRTSCQQDCTDVETPIQRCIRQHASAYVSIRQQTSRLRCSCTHERTHARTHARTRPRHSSVCCDSDKDISRDASRVPTRLEAPHSPRTHTDPSHSHTSRLQSTSHFLGTSFPRSTLSRLPALALSLSLHRPPFLYNLSSP